MFPYAVLLDIVAPWIAAAWWEALGAWSFALPALALERDLAVVAIAAAGLALLLVTSAAIRHLPRSARRAALLLLIPVLLAPAVAAGGTRYGDQARGAITRTALALWHAARPSAPGSKTAAKGEGPVPPRSGSEPAVDAVVAAVAPAPPVPARVQPSAAEIAGATIKRLSGYLVRKAALRFDTRVVPVFFGTDRAASTDGAGPDYTAERAGGLTLGRVLVSLPSASGAGPSGAAAVSGIKAMPRDQVQEAARLQAGGARRTPGRALIYVHGFNTSFQAAAVDASNLAEALQFDGALFVYSWASEGRAVRYRHDAQNAAETEPELRDFLMFAGQQANGRSVSIVADGLGAGAVVRALAGMREHGSGGIVFDDLILRAPDIDRATFGAKIGALAPLAGRITLYATAADRALNISRRYAGSVPRAGDVTPQGPAVFAGVATVDVTPPAESKAPGFAAGDWPPVLFADLKARLAPGGEDGDPSARGLEAVTAAQGTYWRAQPVARAP